MCESTVLDKVNALSDWFKEINQCTIATSGGIDSMILAYVASLTIKANALIAHSASLSVPTLDAARIKTYSEKYHWNLALLPAGEMDNENYRNNPVNRCYFCKSSLFEKLKKLNHGVLITGTNQDDLGDYRPGLIAAKEQGVRQPYVELGINKNMIRQIAHYFQLNDLKDIPASPCLSSRIETGVYINPEYLVAIDEVENFARHLLNTDIVRFRIRNEKVELELSPEMLDRLSDKQRAALENKINSIISSLPISQHIDIAAYKKGSAFIGVKVVE